MRRWNDYRRRKEAFYFVSLGKCSNVDETLPTFYTLFVQETKVHFAEPLPGRQLCAAQKTPWRNLCGKPDERLAAVRVWEQTASCVCRAEAPRQSIDPGDGRVTGRVLLLYSTAQRWFKGTSAALDHKHSHQQCCVWSTEAPPNSSQQHFQVPRLVSLQWFSSALSKKRAMEPSERNPEHLAQCPGVGIVTKVFVFRQTHFGMQAESSLVTAISSPRFSLACTQKVSGTAFTTLLRCSMNHHCCVGYGLKNTAAKSSVYCELKAAEGPAIPCPGCTGSASHPLWSNSWVWLLSELAVSSTLLWVQFNSQHWSSKWNSALIPQAVLWKSFNPLALWGHQTDALHQNYVYPMKEETRDMKRQILILQVKVPTFQPRGGAAYHPQIRALNCSW